MKLYKILSLLLLCWYSYPAYTQAISKIKHEEDNNHNPKQALDYNFNVQHFGVAEGLSHREALCIFQDSRSFIWIGTQYGLNRFNGHEFRTFTRKNQGLVSNEVHQIIEDTEGWLWVFSKKNKTVLGNILSLSFVNIYTLEVKNIKERFGDNAPPELDKINSAISSPDRVIYIGTKMGSMIKFHPNDGFKVYKVEGQDQIVLRKFSAEQTLVGNNRKANGRSHFLEIDTLGHVLIGNGNRKYIAQDKEGKKWYSQKKKVSNKNNLYLYNLKEDVRSEVIDISDLVESKRKKSFYSKYEVYLRETDETFWIKDGYRFFVFHPKRGLLYNFKEKYSAIIESIINQLYFDDKNNIWVATANGVYKIQMRESPFKKYLSSPKETYSINNAISTRGLLVHKGHLWVNNEKGRQQLIDLNTQQITVVDNISLYNENKQKTKTSNLTSILKTKEQQLLLGGGGYLVGYQWNGQNHRIIYWENRQFHSRIWSLFQDQQGHVWCGLQRRGLGGWDTEKDNLKLYDQYNSFDLLSKSTVYTFLQWDKNHFLVGSSSGIYLVHQQEGVKARFWEKGKEQFHFPNDVVYHLHKDKKEANVIWVATDGGGLVRWHFPIGYDAVSTNDSILSQIKQFTIAEGLSSNVLYAVYEDDHSNLWIPSEYGLIRFDKTTTVAKAFLERDGISYNEFNRISHFQDTSGILYFGGLNGLTVFHPDSIFSQEQVFNSPLEVLKYQLYDGTKNQLEDKTLELLTDSVITLQAGDRFFQLDFALLEYQDATHIRYAYKVEGHIDSWTMIKENRLMISGLPYGNYVLHIKGQGANGEFSRHEIQYPIQVLRPFYLKFSFFAIVISAFLLAVFLFYNWRTKRLKQRQKELETKIIESTEMIRQQNEQLKELDKVKSRFFANVSHELKTPVTLILGPLSTMLRSGFLTAKDTSLAEISKKNARNLLNLVNEILDLTKMESGKIELHEETQALYPLLKLIIGAFEGIAQQKNIDYLCVYQASPQLYLKLDVKKIRKLINNLLSNAFKFTPRQGQIMVRLEDNGTCITLSVKDSGRGIHPDDLPHVFDRFYQSAQANQPKEGGTGIGLSLCMEFAKLMKGKLWVESVLDEGSTFYFEFPKKETLVLPSSVSATASIPQPNDLEIKELDLENISTPILNVQKSTILLVEDNDNLRKYIQLIIGEKYKLLAVENGQVAWNLLTKNNRNINLTNEQEEHPEALSLIHDLPDLIISDIMMPEMDGYQLLEKIKGDDRFRGIPIIMLTALSDLRDKLKALRIGVDDYMTKPFEERELLARVENLIMHNYWRKAYQNDINQTSEGMSSSQEEASYPSKPLSKEDSEWLENLEKTILRKIGQFNLSIEQLAYDMAASRWQLNRRIKQFTGLTAKHYLQEIRLNHARNLLEQGECSTIKALTYEIGIKDVRHFSRQFKKRFGKIPSEYL